MNNRLVFILLFIFLLLNILSAEESFSQEYIVVEAIILKNNPEGVHGETLDGDNFHFSAVTIEIISNKKKGAIIFVILNWAKSKISPVFSKKGEIYTIHIEKKYFSEICIDKENQAIADEILFIKKREERSLD